VVTCVISRGRSSSQVWGEGTTACASDSKKFSAWDQNLMTEWHILDQHIGAVFLLSSFAEKTEQKSDEVV
jgi:hypothetical protein